LKIHSSPEPVLKEEFDGTYCGHPAKLQVSDDSTEMAL
jgi:hypothetical protein